MSEVGGELSNDHLREGDVLSVFGLHGDNKFKIVKIVKVRSDGLHLFVYNPDYSERPRAETETTLPAGMDLRQTRNMYFPVSRKLFSMMRPVFLDNRPVADPELNGYRQWCLTGHGAIIGDQFTIESEVDDNLKIYSKIFFTYFTPTLIAFTFYMIALGYENWFRDSFLIGIAFGAVMVVLQWAGTISKRRDATHKVSASSTQFSEIELPVPFPEAFESGVKALESIKNCKPILLDKHGGTIEARVSASVVEEGQEILIAFSKLDDSKTVAVVWSECVKGLAMDMGKNLGNVNAIISYLKSSTTSKQPFSPEVVDNKAAQSDKLDTA